MAVIKAAVRSLSLRVYLLKRCPPREANLDCSSLEDGVKCHNPASLRVELRFKSDSSTAWTTVCDKHFQAVALWPTYVGSPDVVDDSENIDD